ncbi:uncharacterized protein VTP21DRAFT_10226 [Calcarisporiella thermophila]|uniref:uncharacterized protein n=1 Tax=Calcarisporiella thermophila TaxID=911321 RepID=UPI0037427EDA
MLEGETVTFNVGGHTFEISLALVLSRQPNSQLAKLARECLHSNSLKPIFLDHNSSAFAVVLDYIRYGRVFIPPDVSRQVVELILNDMNIEYTEEDINKELNDGSGRFIGSPTSSNANSSISSQSLAGTLSTTASAGLPSYSEAIASSASSASIDANYNNYVRDVKGERINTASELLRSKVERLFRERLLHVLNGAIYAGYKKLEILLAPERMPIDKDVLHNFGDTNTVREWVGIPPDESDPDEIRWMLQSEAMGLLKSSIENEYSGGAAYQRSLSVLKHVIVGKTYCTVKRETEWGLMESVGKNLIKIEITYR